MRQIFAPTDRPDLSSSAFHELMQWRVRKVLLVSSLYDSFMLAEDRLAEELLRGDFLGVSLSTIPDITRVSTGAHALEAIRQPPGYDLVISSPIVGDMDAGRLARELRHAGYEIPVIMLAYHARELHDYLARHDVSGIDRSFLFQGDIQLFLAIVKYAEDMMNVQHDVDVMGVQVILVVEDNIRYYSSFLPTIYTVLLQHTASLVPEGINLAHKLLRARARPKIILASDYEKAWEYFQTYEENVLGVISDVEFPKGGELCADAGVQFARKLRSRHPDVPVVLHSGKPENEKLAREAGASFLLKYSPRLLQDLRKFMLANFGFGYFVFRLPDGTEVGRANDLKELQEALGTVPAASIEYHAAHNHFSAWLKAHTEFDIAYRLRPRRLSDFDGPEGIRQYLISAIRSHREDRHRATVTDFDRGRFRAHHGFAKLGGGSLGGKARGLAFANRLLDRFEMEERFAGVRVAVPPILVIATDVFDEFLDSNDLRDLAITSNDDTEIEAQFRTAPFPEAIRDSLRTFLALAEYPLAVRSSSLLEDAKYQPFAGIYDTVMIPNDHPDPEIRLEHLVQAIKRIYASTFSQRAKHYIATTSYRLEEEKMAVILQRLVGARHGDRFYPEFAGVALSQNFYPVGPIEPEDGLAAVALGMGAAVVEGEACLRFSPKHPERLLQFSSVRDALRNSQREFYALRLGESSEVDRPLGTDLAKYDLSVAHKDGTLRWTGSTYSHENDRIYDGVSRPGTKLVTFAPVLKHSLFPLAEILSELLDLGKYGAGGQVEIEFAVNLSVPPGEPQEFGFLQLRPVAHTFEPGVVDLSRIDRTQALCESSSVLGTGRVDDVSDLVVVDYHAYERGQSRQVAGQVASLNARLAAKDTPYILIGVGRWGSNDPLLGIPVTWDQISGARVIVEAGFKDFSVTPSQGTHFFQNLVANNIGYFTVNPEAGGGAVDWEWLAAQPAVEETQFVRHLRLEQPAVVLMNGNRNQGVILRPGASELVEGEPLSS